MIFWWYVLGLRSATKLRNLFGFFFFFLRKVIALLIKGMSVHFYHSTNLALSWNMHNAAIYHFGGMLLVIYFCYETK